ncbi:hypothetical protein DPV78_003402, partial [Talaromyces pinophilus]
VPLQVLVRVYHEGRSSIFFCNFVIDISVQESQHINMRCGNLIQPAKRISDACAIGYSYTSGYVTRSMDDGPYLVVIGDYYVFAP